MHEAVDTAELLGRFEHPRRAPAQHHLAVAPIARAAAATPASAGRERTAMRLAAAVRPAVEPAGPAGGGAGGEVSPFPASRNALIVDGYFLPSGVASNASSSVSAPSALAAW